MVTSIVLIGGKSARLGKDKTVELLEGESLLQRVISRLNLISDEIIMVTSQGKSCRTGSFPTGVKVIEDLVPDMGPLGGIYSGLTESSSFYNMVVACDMPFLNVPLLRYMLEVSPSYDVVVPKVGELFEPLHAIYSKDCISPIKSYMEEGGGTIPGFYPRVKVRYIGDEELNRFDPEHLSFFNINTQKDLDKARKLVRSSEPVK